jgi:hypothetical protein
MKPSLRTLHADPDAAQWLAFAREHAERAPQLPRMPTDREVTNEGLTPYLGRWSPYGPKRERHAGPTRGHDT